jgi:hypothetical protein
MSSTESLFRVIGETDVIDQCPARQLRQSLGALRHFGFERKGEGSHLMGRGTSNVRFALCAPVTAGDVTSALPIEVSSATGRAAEKTTTGRLFRRSATSRHGVEANLNTHGRVE